MARTTFATNDSSTVKLWAKALAVEVLKATPLRPLIGEGSDMPIKLLRDTEKGAGDRVRYSLLMQLSGDGVTSGETLEGNEESLTYYTDDLYVDELHHAVKVPVLGRNINAQRVQLELRRDARDQLRNWFVKRMSVAFFNQVCGYTPQTNTKYTGMNSVAAPVNIIRAGTATADEGLGNTDTFTLDLIDKARELAETADLPLSPIMVDGDEKYVIYLHPYQITALRTSTSTGQWLDIQKAAMQGGKVSGNPIFTGALGEYNGVVLRKANDITQGVNSSTGAAVSNVRRAVLLGTQAATYAIGRKGKKADFTWAEEDIDYGRELGVAALSVWGMKKCQFNSNDFGTIVISTYAAKST